MRVYRVRRSVDNIVVNGVFHVRSRVGNTEDALNVGIVFREQEVRRAFAVQPKTSAAGVIEFNRRIGPDFRHMQFRPRFTGVPGPGIPEPDGREQPQAGGFGAPVFNGNFDQDVFDVGLRIFHEHIEVAIVGKHSRVEKFKLWIALAATPVFRHQLVIRKRRVRIFIQKLHVRVSRRAVEVEVIFLHVLAVISLVAGEPKKAFLQDRVALIPHRKGKTDELMTIADSTQAVFIPAVGTRARMIVGEILPRRPMGAVVFANCPPRAVAEIGAPTLPVPGFGGGFRESDFFLRHCASSGPSGSSPTCGYRCGVYQLFSNCNACASGRYP